MAKKKQSGKNKVPRRPVQFPIDWLALARRMAGKRRQPTLWFLLSLVAEQAEKDGEQIPPHAPWSPEPPE